MCNAAAYIPMATDGDPFSMEHRVARLMPARSATNSADSFLFEDGLRFGLAQVHSEALRGRVWKAGEDVL